MVDFKALVSGAPVKKDHIVSAKKGLIEAIQFGDDGTEHKIQYEAQPPCYSCQGDYLWSGQSGGCPICDKLMTLEEYNESQKADEMEFTLEPEPTVKVGAEATFTMVEEVPIPLENVEAEIVDKKEEPPTNALAITTTTPDFTAIQNTRPLTFEEKKVKILQTMALIEYTANNALNKDDFWTPKGSRKKALTRSGCNKLATIFNITTETLKIWVVKEPNIKGEEDIVAYATVKATRPGGSSVTITANKALSSYESDRPGAKPPREWVDMQALKGTAETRASNRAIQNAIGVVPKGYMVATAEEFNRKG